MEPCDWRRRRVRCVDVSPSVLYSSSAFRRGVLGRCRLTGGDSDSSGSPVLPTTLQPPCGPVRGGLLSARMAEPPRSECSKACGLELCLDRIFSRALRCCSSLHVSSSAERPGVRARGRLALWTGGSGSGFGGRARGFDKRSADSSSCAADFRAYSDALSFAPISWRTSRSRSSARLPSSERCRLLHSALAADWLRRCILARAACSIRSAPVGGRRACAAGKAPTGALLTSITGSRSILADDVRFWAS
jgi:hypothetical protein